MALSQDRLRTLLAWVVILLLLGPIGSALWLGFVHGDSPCILCWAQRTSMILIALVALFVIRYGARPRYLGMVVLLGTWGVFMALRHSALHLARDVGQGFSISIFGVHTYVWSWFIHWTVLAVIGVLLLLLREGLAGGEPRALNVPGRVAFGLFIVMVAANAVQAFASTGPPPYIGQGDPVRLSLNPRHWVWMNEELQGHVSLRGSWTIPVPDPAHVAVDPDPSHGPLANLPSLHVTSWERITAPLNGTLTDLSRSPSSSAFLAVTDRYGVYVLDSTLSRVLHHAVLDPGYSIDLTPLAGAAFLGDTLAVLSTNKSYALLRPDPRADADLEWRYFLETDSAMAELQLGRFATVRARQMYVLSLAYDPHADELITVTVPSPRQRRLVVSRFARADFTLSSEFVPRLAPGLATSGERRPLSEYVVTGAVVGDGLLYAISAAYSTLLIIDLQEKIVRGAYTVDGIEQPVGLAARDAQLLVAQADGRVAVIDRPTP
jgi:hypothetical protein